MENKVKISWRGCQKLISQFWFATSQWPHNTMSLTFAVHYPFLSHDLWESICGGEGKTRDEVQSRHPHSACHTFKARWHRTKCDRPWALHRRWTVNCQADSFLTLWPRNSLRNCFGRAYLDSIVSHLLRHTICHLRLSPRFCVLRIWCDADPFMVLIECYGMELASSLKHHLRFSGLQDGAICIHFMTTRRWKAENYRERQLHWRRCNAIFYYI